MSGWTKKSQHRSKHQILQSLSLKMSRMITLGTSEESERIVSFIYVDGYFCAHRLSGSEGAEMFFPRKYLYGLRVSSRAYSGRVKKCDADRVLPGNRGVSFKKRKTRQILRVKTRSIRNFGEIFSQDRSAARCLAEKCPPGWAAREKSAIICCHLSYLLMDDSGKKTIKNFR